MKDLEELLQELRHEGHLDSKGVFTSSHEGALDRLSERLLPDPQMYLLKCVQALTAGGAETIEVAQKIAWIEVTARGMKDPPVLDPLDWVSQAWRSPVPAIRHLATALVGGWRLFDEIQVDWLSLRWRLVPGEGTTPQKLESHNPRHEARICFKRKHWKLLSDAPPYFDRLFACPVKVASPWLSGFWQIRAYSGERHFPRPGAELVGALAIPNEGGPLLVPDMVRGWPVFFSPPRLEPPVHTTTTKPHGMNASWFHASRVYFLIDQDDPSILIPIDEGVALDPVPVDLGVTGIYCVVSVQREGLETDLSQFRLRQDEAFQKLVADLRSEARRVHDEVVEQLTHWKPRADLQSQSSATAGGFLAGGVLGFGLIVATGWMFPFHFLALPGAMLGAYYGGKLWRKRALKRLRERAAEMEP